MAVQTSSTQDFTMSTAAVWQALWGAVFDAFITLNGWTYVAQTGDGDPNSATPGAAGTYACFRVYSTSVGAETWYMRVDFGYTSTGPSLKVQFGSAVDGSGTLTGQRSTQQTLTFSANHLSTGQTYFISSAAGRLFWWAGPASAGGNDLWGFSVHGGVDGSGAMNSGVDLFTPGGSQNIPASGTVPSFRTFIPCNNGNSASEVIGSHTMTFHPFTWNESGGNNPSPAIMIGGTTDFPSAGVVVTATIYSATRNFLATALTSNFSNNQRLNFLYE